MMPNGLLVLDGLERRLLVLLVLLKVAKMSRTFQ
jgi:hypothetical protein